MSVIELKDIMKTYQMGDSVVHALYHVNLKIEPGEFTSIMGPSGSGKSTMMNILGCLDRPTSGEYFLDGKEIAGYDDDELAHTRNAKIGFVFQNFNLLAKLTAQENVALPLVYAGVDEEERMERAKKALEAVGLGDRLEHKPMEMSGGQRQRVAIARALINNPAIIMADEPTGNLDTKSSYEIMDIFKKMNESGKTVVMVTHEPDIAEQTKRILVMRDGQLVSDERSGGRTDYAAKELQQRGQAAEVSKAEGEAAQKHADAQLKQAKTGETTVKTHVRSLLTKLDARDRVALVVLAHGAGLVGGQRTVPLT